MKAKHLLGVALVVICAACTESGEPTEQRSERERDSLIAGSRLPGAAGVRGAIRARDEASALNARVDSIAGSIDHN